MSKEASSVPYPLVPLLIGVAPWWSLQKKTGNQGGRWTTNIWIPNASGRHTTLAPHSNSHSRYHQTQRKQFWTRWMATINTPRWRISTSHDLHHRMGSFHVSQNAPRVCSFGWRLYTKVRWDNKDIPRKIKVVDDTLLYDKTIKDAFYHTLDYLSLCEANGIVINKDKFQFCQDVVQFGGLQITSTGVTPSNDLLNANFQLPKP